VQWISYSLRMRATIGSIYRWFKIIRLCSIVIFIIHNCNAGFEYYIYSNSTNNILIETNVKVIDKKY
jgi:hypothetical protein